MVVLLIVQGWPRIEAQAWFTLRYFESVSLTKKGILPKNIIFCLLQDIIYIYILYTNTKQHEATDMERVAVGDEATSLVNFRSDLLEAQPVALIVGYTAEYRWIPSSLQRILVWTLTWLGCVWC